MYTEFVAFLRKTMRVREIVVLVRLSHSHGFAQKRNAFLLHGTAPSVSIALGPLSFVYELTKEVRTLYLTQLLSAN